MGDSRTRPAWTPPRVRILLAMFAFYLAAALFDGWSTLIVAGDDPGAEMNPFMRAALGVSPGFFFVLKLTLDLGFGALLAALSRRRRFAWLAFCAMTGIHAALFIFQATLFIMVPPPTLNPFSSAANHAADFSFSETKKRPAKGRLTTSLTGG